MSASMCGIDCSLCEQRGRCKGCAETMGKPFGGSCAVAQCCVENGHDSCKNCGNVCQMREKLLLELNSLGVAADESFLLVSELDADGNNAEIVVYKKRK
ncbi:MAG: DUF3795 domain-containing protein [Ruminococcaceae bacterium]|nr:DUF3795 domain-containing protein [Oscillospiraceae bacterium]